MMYWAHLVAMALIRGLPAWVVDPLVLALAPHAARLWDRQWQATRANAQVLLGPGVTPRQVERCLERTFRNYARYLLELVRLPGTAPEMLERGFEVRGWEHLRAARARGRGVVLLTLHMGNWDAAGALLAGRGVPVTVLVDRLQPPRWDALVQRTRRELGMQTLPVDANPRAMLQVLRQNQVLGVLLDRPLSEGGCVVSWCGRPTRLPDGGVRLALLADAAVVAAAITREQERYVVQISPPLEPRRRGSRRERAAEVMGQALAWLEPWVRAHPDQWFMFRPFWPVAPALDERRCEHAHVVSAPRG